MFVTVVKLSYHVDTDQNITLEQQIFIEIGQLLNIYIAEYQRQKVNTFKNTLWMKRDVISGL